MTRSRMLAALATTLLILPLPGAAPVAAQSDPVYYLPAPAGTTLTVLPPIASSLSQPEAIDFGAVVGGSFPVVAARGGTVIGVRTDVPDGGCPYTGQAEPPACWTEVNRVLIDHGDGTSALYMHLMQGGSPVAIGQPIEIGTPLGMAGLSGWSSGMRLRFQVQATPSAAELAQPGGFLGPALPVSFSDPDVLAESLDGRVAVDGSYISGNPGSDTPGFTFPPATAPPGTLPPDSHPPDTGPIGYGTPVARPLDLPARVPWADGVDLRLNVSPDDAEDGHGLEVAAPYDEPDLAVYPLFGGRVLYAGCATGSSAGLGRVVVVEREAGGSTYQAVHAHLDSIEPQFLVDPAPDATIDTPIGRMGSSVTDAFGSCDASDGGDSRLSVILLRDAYVTLDGVISDGRSVDPEPLLGDGLYEGFAWWRGPLTAAEVEETVGDPRIQWGMGVVRDGAHVAFGDPVTLVARVRDRVDVREVRFTAYYPEWPDPRQAARSDGFDARRDWRILAVCRPPGMQGEPPTTRGCRWDGTETDALVTFRWDPTLDERVRSVPWLPAAQPAITATSGDCVPVTLGAEVVDVAGYRAAVDTSRPVRACDQGAADVGRVAYLDPPSPPPAPRNVELQVLYGKHRCPHGGVEAECTWPWRLTWDDVDGETGYKIYSVNTTWFFARDPAECIVVRKTEPKLLATLPADTTARNGEFQPEGSGTWRDPRVSGSTYLVTAFNAAGESRPGSTQEQWYEEVPDCLF